MLQDGCTHAGVLIIPPANSVAVLIESQQIALFDSHQPEEVGQAISELSRELSTSQIAPFSHCVLK